MQKILAALFAVPMLAGCAGVSVGVGAVGVSGNVAGGVSVSTDLGARSSGEGVSVPVNLINATGVGAGIGTLILADTSGGLRIEAALGSLPPGERGFHLHEKGDCGPGLKDGKPAAGMAAGPHFDPAGTGAHKGPDGGGHRGDLPRLVVDASGNATGIMVLPHLSLRDVRGRSFVIHEGGDNYADDPKPLGGAGGRIACGVVPSAS